MSVPPEKISRHTLMRMLLPNVIYFMDCAQSKRFSRIELHDEIIQITKDYYTISSEMIYAEALELSKTLSKEELDKILRLTLGDRESVIQKVLYWSPKVVSVISGLGEKAVDACSATVEERKIPQKLCNFIIGGIEPDQELCSYIKDMHWGGEMKVSELIQEQPFSHDGDMSKDGDIDKNLPQVAGKDLENSQYKLLFKIKAANGKDILMCKFKSDQVIIRGLVKKNTGSYGVVYSFHTYPKADEIPNLKTTAVRIQEKNVFVAEEYRKQSLSTKVYTWLLDNGYCLISDVQHFAGTERLWRSLCEKAGTKYTAMVYNKETRVLQKYSPELEEIWTYGQDYVGSDNVIILYKN